MNSIFTTIFIALVLVISFSSAHESNLDEPRKLGGWNNRGGYFRQVYDRCCNDDGSNSFPPYLNQYCKCPVRERYSQRWAYKCSNELCRKAGYQQCGHY